MTRKFYFAGSIRAGRSDVPIYEKLIGRMKQHGTVLTEHVGDYALSLKGQTNYTDQYIHDRDLEWLYQSECVIAETTVPSLGVGYEIACAISRKIPVYAFHRTAEADLSAMISGSPNIEVYEYNHVTQAMKRIDAILAAKG